HYMYVLPYTDHLPLSLHDALPISASANMRFNAGLETRSFIPISHTMGGGKVIEGVLFSGQRLDKALAEASGLSRERVKALMAEGDRKSTRLNSSHVKISYAVICLK